MPSGKTLAGKTLAAGVVLALSTALCLTGTAAAGIIGVNAIFDNNGGAVYVPFTPAYSGTLGDPGPNGPIGLTREKVKLSQGQVSEGAVSFMLYFDLTGEVAPDFDIVADSASLLLRLKDVDFLPVEGRTTTYYEWMELTVLTQTQSNLPVTDGDTPILGAVGGLVIDASNYGEYRDDGFGKTNKIATTYTLSLPDDLGVTPAEIAQIEENLEFSLLVTIGSHLERTRKGSGTYPNKTKEELANSFEFTTVAVPEPTTLALLALTAPVLILRRRA